MFKSKITVDTIIKPVTKMLEQLVEYQKELHLQQCKKEDNIKILKEEIIEIGSEVEKAKKVFINFNKLLT